MKLTTFSQLKDTSILESFAFSEASMKDPSLKESGRLTTVIAG